jgi:hypothetical protein
MKDHQSSCVAIDARCAVVSDRLASSDEALQARKRQARKRKCGGARERLVDHWFCRVWPLCQPLVVPASKLEDGGAPGRGRIVLGHQHGRQLAADRVLRAWAALRRGGVVQQCAAALHGLLQSVLVLEDGAAAKGAGADPCARRTQRARSADDPVGPQLSPRLGVTAFGVTAFGVTAFGGQVRG